MRKLGKCRCGSDLVVVWASEPTGTDSDLEITGCAHCDNVCILNRRACPLCRYFMSPDPDVAYYDYGVL